MVVRRVNKRVYREFKRKTVEENTSIGKAITDAMLYWLKMKNEVRKSNPKGLLKLNGIIKAGKHVRWSEEIDEVLYGGSV